MRSDIELAKKRLRYNARELFEAIGIQLTAEQESLLPPIRIQRAPRGEKKTKEERAAIRKARIAADPAAAKAKRLGADKRYQERHREEILARARARYWEHKKEISEKARLRYQKKKIARPPQSPKKAPTVKAPSAKAPRKRGTYNWTAFMQPRSFTPQTGK